MSDELFRISLIVYAIIASIFFITFEVMLVVLYIKFKSLLLKIDKIADSAVDIEIAIKNRIEAVSLFSSLQKIIDKYLKKE